MLTVMTMNINYTGDRFGPWEVRRGLIREVIQENQPDLIAFQAVRRDPTMEQAVDQAKQMASFLPEYHSVWFEPAVRLPSGVEDGSAFLSRQPIVNKDRLELSMRPRLEDDTRRVVLHAQLDLPGGPLHVFNAHFSWVPEQAQDNLRETLRWMDQFEGQRLLVGDLNTPPVSAVFEPLRQAGWSDAWLLLHPDENGFTFFETGQMVKRIDYFWVDESLKTKVEAIKIVADQESALQARPSDHAALVARFSI